MFMTCRILCSIYLSFLAPLPPTNVKASFLLNNVMQISWKEPFFWNGVPAKYEVEYQTDNLSKRIDVLYINKNHKQGVNVTNLTGFSDYRVRVG